MGVPGVAHQDHDGTMSPLEALNGEITITYPAIVQIDRESCLPYQETFLGVGTTRDRGHRGGERKSVFPMGLLASRAEQVGCCQVGLC